MADVSRLVRIYTGVLDHELARSGHLGCFRWCAKFGHQGGAVKKAVQVSGAGNFDPVNQFDRFQLWFKRLSDGARWAFLTRLLLDLPGKLKSDRKREIPELGSGRHL